MSDLILEPPDDEALLGRQAGDVERVAEAIRGTSNSWTEPEEPVDLGKGLAWRPMLVHEQGYVLHVHMTGSLPNHVFRRLQRASEAGRRTHIALELSHLYDHELVAKLAELDAYVFVVTLEGENCSVAPADHVLAVVADEQVPVESDVRTSVGLDVWERLGVGTSWERGKRLEALLSFLLSQIVDLRVRSRNYRTDTEEIDIVLQVDNPSNRCWHESGVPFVMVEAKNRVDPAGQSDVTVFVGKILTKRGKVKVGLIFSVSGFTSDAVLQETKLGQSQQVSVALIGPEEMRHWIASEDPDQYLEDMVMTAMLR